MKILREGLRIIFYSLLFFLFVALLGFCIAITKAYPIAGLIIVCAMVGGFFYIRASYH